MATVYDVLPENLIKNAAEELKKNDKIKSPIWAAYVKTGAFKQRPPVDGDWWYMRTASILRKIYIQGPIGVSKLRTLYGGKKNRGYSPERFYKGSGSIIRKSIQQLELAGLIKTVDKSVHKGRIITPQGKSFLDKIASKILSTYPRIKKEKIAAEVAEEPKKPKNERRKPIPPAAVSAGTPAA